MTEKDNANPIIYTQTSSAKNQSSYSSVSSSEWWRDPTIHNSSTKISYDSFDPSDDQDEDDEVDDRTRDQGTTAQNDDQKQIEEKIDSQEIFDLIRSITDPEHPLTLEQLAVVDSSYIKVTNNPDRSKQSHVLLEFQPTIPHCSMATLIGLSLRVRLLRSLPSRFKVDIRVREGSHQSENAVNKQLNDKERVAAALENSHLLGVVQGCLSSASRRGKSEEEFKRELLEGKMDDGISRTIEEIAEKLGIQV